MAVVSVDAELADDLEGVLAPVVDVDERVIKRGAVVAREAVAVAERVRGREDVRGDDLIQEPLELRGRQLDVIERLELVAEVRLQSGTVPDLRAVFVLELAKFREELFFKLAFVG